MSAVHRHQSNISYRIMAAYLKFRERFRRPEETLLKLGISEGHKVLDFGCGIGSYTIPAARLVGSTGWIYALDIHPVAVERVQKRVDKEGLKNVATILSGQETGLSDESMDYVLLIDVFTWISDKDELLKELHRVLKDSGVFAVLIDHVDPVSFIEALEQNGLFSILTQEDNFFTLRKK
ncbi:MAG: class I SAM-dependent methyltransferase [Candidatus Thorarchaeota archaeon]